MTKLKEQISYPLPKLVIALSVAFILAVMVSVVFDGERQKHLLIYDIPIIVPFVMFGLDRLIRLNNINTGHYLDILTVTVAISRGFVAVPFVSGHALFLTYALVTSPSRLTRIACLMTLAQVAYLKLFVWSDLTFVGGSIAGCVLAFAYYRTNRFSTYSRV